MRDYLPSPGVVRVELVRGAERAAAAGTPLFIPAQASYQTEQFGRVTHGRPELVGKRVWFRLAPRPGTGRQGVHWERTRDGVFAWVPEHNLLARIEEEE